MSSTFDPRSSSERRRLSHCCWALLRSMGFPYTDSLFSRTSKNVGGHISAVLGIENDDSGWRVGISGFRLSMLFLQRSEP